jgi:hypothetical protein
MNEEIEYMDCSPEQTEEFLDWYAKALLSMALRDICIESKHEKHCCDVWTNSVPFYDVIPGVDTIESNPEKLTV